MNKNVLETATYAFAAVVIVAAGWYWWRQLQSTLELLEMAYPG